jgi:hypothetical protein
VEIDSSVDEADMEMHALHLKQGFCAADSETLLRENPKVKAGGRSTHARNIPAHEGNQKIELTMSAPAIPLTLINEKRRSTTNARPADPNFSWNQTMPPI